MSNTDGAYQSNTPFDDLEIFIGPSHWFVTNLTVTEGSGNLVWMLIIYTASGTTGNAYCDVAAVLKRTGIFSPDFVQQQFGTAASQPGPSGISGTNDPLGIRSYPPMPQAAMPTLIGAQKGYIPKGIKINSIDVIYCHAATMTSVSFGATLNNYLPDLAGSQQAINSVAFIPYAANGLNVNANTPTDTTVVWKTNIPVPANQKNFIITPDSNLVLRYTVVNPGGSNTIFLGCNLKCSYNFQ